MNINKLKLEVIGNTLPSFIPEEGETINICGGLGNRIIYQCKKEDGLFYQRCNEDEEWEEFDLMGIHFKALQDMTNSLYLEFDKQEKVGITCRFKRFLKNMLR